MVIPSPSEMAVKDMSVRFFLKGVFFAAVVVVIVFSAELPFTYAATLGGQPDDSTDKTTTGFGANAMEQCFPITPDGNLPGTIQIETGNQSNWTQWYGATWDVRFYASSDCSGAIGLEYSSTDSGVSSNTYSPNTIVGTTTYTMPVAQDNGSFVANHLAGLNSVQAYFNPVNVVSFYPGFPNYKADAGGTNFYVILYDTNGPTPPDTSTRFTSYTPVLGTTTPIATSTTFTIGVTGYINPSDFVTGSTRVYYRYHQSTGQGKRGNSIFGTSGSGYFYATSSGAFSFSTTTDIENSGVYNIYWDIDNPYSIFGIQLSSAYVLTSTIGTFIAGVADATEIAANQLLIETTGGGLVTNTVPTDATSSSLFSMSNGFNLVPIIMGKFPFNWVTTYAGVLEGLSSSTATTTIPDVSVNYGGLKELQAIPTTTPMNLTFVFFGSTTFNQVSQISGIQSARTLLGWTLWIGLIMYVWRRATSVYYRVMQ